jgi:hypothetical protein
MEPEEVFSSIVVSTSLTRMGIAFVDANWTDLDNFSFSPPLLLRIFIGALEALEIMSFFLFLYRYTKKKEEKTERHGRNGKKP